MVAKRPVDRNYRSCQAISGRFINDSRKETRLCLSSSFDHKGVPDAGHVAVAISGRICNESDLAKRFGLVCATSEELVRRLFLLLDIGFVDVLEGDFAAAVYDYAAHRLILAREALGVEPLYFSPTSDGIVFAQSVRQLVAQFDVSPELDPVGVNIYLAFQFCPLRQTVCRNISKIAAGETIEMKATGMRLYPSSKLSIGRHSQVTRDEAFEEVTSRIEGNFLLTGLRDAACQGQIGAFASGGVDSSVNLVVLSRLGMSPVALTAAFNQQGFDESPFAALVAGCLELEHRVANVGSEALELAAQLASSLCEPIGDQAVLPTYLLLRQCGHGLHLVVSGEGGDEIWGPPRRWKDLERLGQPLIDCRKLAGEYLELISCWGLADRRQLLRDLRIDRGDDEAPIEILANLYSQSRATDVFGALKYGQMRTWMVDNVVAKDRDVGKVLGFEIRFPLAASPLRAWISSLAPPVHNACCVDKSLLRSSLASAVPDEVARRPKHNFLVPMSFWRSREFVSELHLTLLGESSRTRSLWAKPHLTNLINRFDSGDAKLDRPLWALYMLEHWYRSLT